MKYKGYINKNRKIIETLDEKITILNILTMIEKMGNEVGRDFSYRLNVFLEKEKQLIVKEFYKIIKKWRS